MVLPSQSIVHKMMYFEVEIFSGWNLYIYSFQRELDCCSGNIFWLLSRPLCYVLQLNAFYDKLFDIISTILESSKMTVNWFMLLCFMLNVTEDVAMIFHMGNLLHLLQLVVILFLWLFWYISLSSARDGKENGDILKIIHYLKQVFWGQSLELDECYARCLLTTVSWGLHRDK